ncbi:MAG: delta-60 repeat domain-containing protein, partial [Candidatus Methylomirabilales bacterium]
MAFVASLLLLYLPTAPASAAAGDLDTTFDGDGKVVTPILTRNDQAFAVAVASDGKIVAAGRANNGSDFDFALARYNPDGTLDTSFDTDGKVATDLDGREDEAFAVAIQPDGKIVAAGKTDSGPDTDFALARYNPDGTLDTSFDTDGKVSTDIDADNDEASGVALASGGKIVAAGDTN